VKEAAGEISDSSRAYLYAVIRRRVVEEAKRTPVDLYPNMEEISGPAVPYVDIEARVDQVNALSTLAPDCQEGLYRVLALGYTQQEAARDMGRSPGTIASWISRNRRHLMQMLTVVGCALLASWVYASLSMSMRLRDPQSWVVVWHATEPLVSWLTSASPMAYLLFALGVAAILGLWWFWDAPFGEQPKEIRYISPGSASRPEPESADG
jgi:predicted DNA-binding protein (UPF0251 family)